MLLPDSFFFFSRPRPDATLIIATDVVLAMTLGIEI